ncbi:hypothetical protein [Streptomyces sp. NPDC008125]
MTVPVTICPRRSVLGTPHSRSLAVGSVRHRAQDAVAVRRTAVTRG